MDSAGPFMSETHLGAHFSRSEINGLISNTQTISTLDSLIRGLGKGGNDGSLEGSVEKLPQTAY